MPWDDVLQRDWDSRWRPVRNLLAVLVTVVLFGIVPYGLLLNALGGSGLDALGVKLGRNAGLVLVTGLWTLVILTLFGGHLRAAYRDYKRHF